MKVGWRTPTWDRGVWRSHEGWLDAVQDGLADHEVRVVMSSTSLGSRVIVSMDVLQPLDADAQAWLAERAIRRTW